MTEKKETDLTLEESFLKLDRLVEKLESRETSLEESFQALSLIHI